MIASPSTRGGCGPRARVSEASVWLVRCARHPPEAVRDFDAHGASIPPPFWTGRGGGALAVQQRFARRRPTLQVPATTSCRQMHRRRRTRRRCLPPLTHPRASHAPLLPTPSPSVARRPAPRPAPCCPIVGILPLLTVGADRWRGAGQVLARRRREARDRTRRLFGLAPAQQGARRRRTKQGDADGGGGGGVAVAAAAVRRLPPSLDPGAGLR